MAKQMQSVKGLFTLLLFALLTLQATAQTTNTQYDQALADSLGADDYGMKSYVLVILKTGTNKTEDKETLNRLFRGHLENINRLAEAGKLVVAGPMKKNDKTYRGIFILDAKTIEEAKALVETDPAVREKLFDVELYEWYGSAALPVYLGSHSKIEKLRP